MLQHLMRVHHVKPVSNELAVLAQRVDIARGERDIQLSGIVCSSKGITSVRNGVGRKIDTHYLAGRPDDACEIE